MCQLIEVSTNLPQTTNPVYIKGVKQTNYMDPCTLALETDKQMMEYYEKWDNESVEEFYDDVEKMNIQLDEFSNTNYTV